MSRVRVYEERGARKGKPTILGDGDSIHLRIEADTQAIDIFGRLYITADGIRWFPKGTKDPPNPEAYSLSWAQLSDIVSR